MCGDDVACAGLVFDLGAPAVAAEATLGLEELDVDSALGEPQRGAHPRDPAADDRHPHGGYATTGCGVGGLELVEARASR